ncbi:MAG: hypothetical protein EOO06_21175 [Chitinophagaceae bacterium]|nr:MAG: hypothetical protein EOO06_21175 [Chitinophagaceae bacterium]
MKKIIYPFALMLCLQTVQAQYHPSEIVAARVADKLRDSLSLTRVQRDSVYNVHMYLYRQKKRVFESSADDAVEGKLQQVENRRDSFYRHILSAQQYRQYKQKKRMLISAN